MYALLPKNYQRERSNNKPKTSKRKINMLLYNIDNDSKHQCYLYTYIYILSTSFPSNLYVLKSIILLLVDIRNHTKTTTLLQHSERK